VGAGRSWERGTEWDAVRVLLARDARTEMGRQRALTAEPMCDAADVERALDATRQAREALATAGPPPLEGLPDIRALLENAAVSGVTLDGPELVRLLPLLDAVPRLAAYGRGVRAVAPDVTEATDALPALHDLRGRLRRALDDDGAVTDSASAALGRMRREVRTRSRRLVDDMERQLQRSDADRIFADRYVTVRSGRYVLPVRVEARARVPGIVHDRSQSGQTIFIEPADAVEANNDLVQLVREEEQEVARILAELSGDVAIHRDELVALVEGVAALDWIFARAHAADRMVATAPTLDPDRHVALRAARHPLLLAQTWKDPSRTVVPVDLELTAERPLLLITGPNAGGKTIALKTLGLLALMTRVGCHLPAAEGSRLPLFTRVYAVIGDDQSVAENLSTFSAFVAQVREILDEVDDRSLVLLDELGAGTDPEEGAALAQAIVEELDARGAMVVATTHLEPLRAFASTHPRARNASVEFDADSLAPTFQLVYDRPGPSYALAIAGRLGLAPSLVARAQAHRSEQAARLGELLARLDDERRTGAAQTLELERRLGEAAARLAAARATEEAADARARTTVERARAEAAALVADIRRAINAEWERLKRGERSSQALEEGRRRVRDAARRLQPPADPAPSPEPLTPGTNVTAEHLGIHGELVGITGAMATVRSGNVTLRIPTSALRVAAGSAARAGRAGAPTTRAAAAAGSGDGADTPSRVASELMLLGRTTDEARDLVEQYLDDAFLAGLPAVRLVHGKGTGALRKAVRRVLSDHPLVESFRDGEPFEGGAGATVAALKVS
jgi:DNA mismatch repair protein MutS2